MKFFDRLSLTSLMILAAFLILAPISPEPHLAEKFRMFQAGTLSKPLDMFDVLWHLSGVFLVLLKLKRGQKHEEVSPDDKGDR